jgi:hypothetical protein
MVPRTPIDAPDDRGDIEAESLLKLLLALAVVWIALEVVGEVVDAAVGVASLARPVVGLVVVGLIVLWLLDRI